METQAAITFKPHFLPAGSPVDLRRDKGKRRRRFKMGDKGKKAKDKGKKQQMAKHDQAAKIAKRKQEKQQKKTP
jgi:hypothetical protein